MTLYTWKRPEHSPFPKIYRRFEVSNGEISYKMRVQDLTSDRYEELWNLYVKHFYPDEPIAKAINMINDPVSMQNEKNTFYEYVKQNSSIVVVLDNSSENPQIVGAHIFRVITRHDQPPKEKRLGPSREILDKFFKKIQGGVDVFEELGVDKYLSSRGLLLLPQFRGLKVTHHMLESLPLLASTLEVHAMNVIWGNPYAMRVAERAGFKVYNELIYEEEKEVSIPIEGVKSAKYSLIKW